MQLVLSPYYQRAATGVRRSVPDRYADFGDRTDPESPISQFLRNNRVNVLKPDMGNMPNVFYAGIDKEVL